MACCTAATPSSPPPAGRCSKPASGCQPLLPPPERGRDRRHGPCPPSSSGLLGHCSGGSRPPAAALVAAGRQRQQERRRRRRRRGQSAPAVRRQLRLARRRWRCSRPSCTASARPPTTAMGPSTRPLPLAADETVIHSAAPPSTSSRCFNRNGEEMSAKRQSRQGLASAAPRPPPARRQRPTRLLVARHSQPQATGPRPCAAVCRTARRRGGAAARPAWLVRMDWDVVQRQIRCRVAPAGTAVTCCNSPRLLYGRRQG